MKKLNQSILILDSDVLLVEKLSALLTAAEYKVIVSRTAKDALLKLDRQSFHYFLFDPTDFGRGGREVFNYYEQGLHTRKSKLIILTHNLDQFVERHDSEGIHQIIEKPFDPIDLLKSLFN